MNTDYNMNMFNLMPTRDDRPKKDGLCTGDYINISCSDCKKPFMGDKRSLTCAPCAYKDKQQ